MRLRRAMLAGLIGALAMSVAMFLMRSAGFNINLEGLLGTIFGSNNYLSAWSTGFVVHLAIGTFLGLFYGVAFEAVGRAGALVGAGLGLANGLLAGMLMTSIPAMSPVSIADNVVAPGAFLTHVHYGPVLFLAAHVVYGLFVGMAYGRTVAQPRLVHKGV